jgi:DNA-directed RNA polymerase alpha subunit
MEDHDLTLIEGAELKAHASGPMPPEAHDHLRKLLYSAYQARCKRKEPIRAEDVDEITNPVIASAFALADDDLARVEEEFAQREAQQEVPPTSQMLCDESERTIIHLAEQVRDVVREAEAEGVRFVIRKRDDSTSADSASSDQAVRDIPVTEPRFFSVRTRRCLLRLNIETLGDLAQRSAADLLEAKNFGMSSLDEVREKLGKYSLRLRGE